MRLLHLFSSSPVKKTNGLLVLALCTMLSGCFAPMLAMGPSQLMWAFIKPFVGLDPSSSQLFEKPMIKNRMTALLGEDYEETLALLRTAPALKQEGTLFYLASPTEDGEAQAAGLVWNAQTNKMSAIVNDGQETKLFNEPNSTVPVVWPKTLQTLVAPTKQGLAKASFSGQNTAVAELTDTEQQLKAAQAQLKALQDQAELQSVQAQIKALQSKATLEASNKTAVKADVKAKVKADVQTKAQLENKAGFNIESTTETKKLQAKSAQ
ncbi:hypothetical protein [Oceanisphaera sp. W20_SRM_FM3]|uniref:hypothetical protein n=1 Tax=Oceanisphaera sp. W20_SRM_FM3 TaxID=3240267 RepID=UPI003F9CEB18